MTSRGRQLKSGKLVEQLVFIPYLIPSMAFGAMYLVHVFRGAGGDLRRIKKLRFSLCSTGSFLLLVLVTVVKNPSVFQPLVPPT